MIVVMNIGPILNNNAALNDLWQNLQLMKHVVPIAYSYLY